jgi:hypothetical protein
MLLAAFTPAVAALDNIDAVEESSADTWHGLAKQVRKKSWDLFFSQTNEEDLL